MVHRRTTLVFAAALSALLLVALAIPLATHLTRAAGTHYYVGPAGSDANDGLSATRPLKTIQRALELAQPGTIIELAAGRYAQDVRSVRAGSAADPIVLRGPADAVLIGAGAARIVEINHNNITLEGFTIDGGWGDLSRADGYRDKLLYVQGKQPRAGVTGLRVLRMTFRNAGGECIRLRYFAQHNEIAESNISSCGVHDFRFGAGGKNGEGIYIGTAPEQRADGKNPTADPDESNANWIHDNSFDTQGNECVDIKEAAFGNIVERNRCTGQRDPESGGFDARGSGNIFRDNQSFGNAGAGIRLGGDTPSDGILNDVYHNSLHDNQAGGIKVQRQPQGRVCGNQISNNAGGDAVGSDKASIAPTGACTGLPTPGATPAVATASPAATPTQAPGGCTPMYAVDGGAGAFIEAENAMVRAGSFALFEQAGRSGQAYVATPGSGTSQDRGNYLSFDLRVRGGGKFYIWLLGYGPSASADSFYVQADGRTRVQANLVQKAWGWKRAGRTITLGDGVHTLRIISREDGARLDKLLLTKERSVVPAELGGPALAAQCL
ncbi:MAG: right-handed parallel beta-helix repeat-containing protein [Kouleothrix sp.]